MRFWPLTGLGEVRAGDDLPGQLADIALAGGMRPGDVLVTAHKPVSKAEGRVIRLADVEPGEAARELADETGKEPELCELILRESRSIVRRRGSLLICETHHGFICANAGIDRSNTPDGTVVLLPVDPDASARAISAAFRDRLGGAVPVVICDTHGRAFRRGLVNVAIGVAGLEPVIDHRGGHDREGRVLVATDQAMADELAAAAGMLMGKDSGTPAIACRGAAVVSGEGSAADLVRDPDEDLFRAPHPAPTTL